MPHPKSRIPAPAGDETPSRAPVRERLLDVASAEFAEKGLTGVGVNEIAEQAGTTKRMLYYHFGSKEGLYLAVLERSYRSHRDRELAEAGRHDDPVDALRDVCLWTFDRFDADPQHALLVAEENRHRGQYLRTSEELGSLRTPALAQLDGILERGKRLGAFRSDVTAIDVHLMIASFTVFRVTNQFTFSALFDYPIGSPSLRDHLRHVLADAVLRYVAVRHLP